MARHWEAYSRAVQNRGAGEETAKDRVWSTVDPPPINVNVAAYILSVSLLVLRRFNVTIRRPRVGGHTRIGTFPDFELVNLRGSQQSTATIAHSLYPFTPFRFDAMFTPSGSTLSAEQIPDSAFDIISSSFHLSSSTLTYTWLIQNYIARVVFQLSCSNWPVVFARIRHKIQQFSDDPDNPTDITDINIIRHSAFTRVKLLEVMTGSFIYFNPSGGTHLTTVMLSSIILCVHSSRISSDQHQGTS